MSKLANIALICSHDNTGYVVKYIGPVYRLPDQNKCSPWTGSKLGLDQNEYTSAYVWIGKN
jgi:hypothetical protein